MVGLLTLNESSFAAIAEKTSTAYIYGLKDDGDPDPSTRFAFQYYPDSVQDSKQVNWAPREIPGASLPIYQWIASGERAISFTSPFTSDVDLGHPDGGQELFDRLKDQGVLRRNVDIRSAIVFLRQFMLPSYGETSEVGTPIAKAPQKLILGLPGSGIGVTGGLAGDVTEQVDDQINAIMLQCDVTYEALFPTGLPRIVTVALSFGQIAQGAKDGSVIFPQRNITFEEAARGGAGTGFFGYPLEVLLTEKNTP